MKLETLFHSLSPEERAFQFGVPTDLPLAKAFPRKRVVHAGLHGTVVGAETSQQIWEDIMAAPPKSMATQTAYIHIPFCKTKCLYCGFFQNGTNQDLEDQYIDCLVKELESAADSPRLRDGLIHAVFIGGGTPTSLSPGNAERLLQAIGRCLPLANDYELTLEGRVHDLEPVKMDIWLANGVNRVSLGVQSFHTKVRRSVGPLDDEETVLRRLQELLDYNQCAVVIDLIYGLPGQTMDIWEKDLALLVQSGVDGADLYQLNVFDGSDLNKAIARGALPPAATTEDEAHMFAFAKEYLEKRAFRRLNVCHWSCSNRERSLYNTLARSGAAMFPFGSGAGGNVDGYSTMLHRAVKPYELFVKAGKKPFMALMKQSPLQPVIDAVQSQLEMCHIDLKKIYAFDERLQELAWLYELWEKRGLVVNNGVMYDLTAAGQFWQVNMTQTTLECIQYLLTGKNTMAIERVAAQDEEKMKPVLAMMKNMKTATNNPDIETMKKMAEAMQHMSVENIRAVMKKMNDK